MVETIEQSLRCVVILNVRRSLFYTPSEPKAANDHSDGSEEEGSQIISPSLAPVRISVVIIIKIKNIKLNNTYILYLNIVNTNFCFILIIMRFKYVL